MTDKPGNVTGKLNAAVDPPSAALSGVVTETCGIVMPIAAMGDYSAQHWVDVRNVLDEAIVAAGFTPNIVSNANEVGVIQKRIVENLYENPIVVCDVSGKNPNVMFELGLRLAFDKPTIIVKDDATSYSFDTGIIEHITYPRDLRYAQIVEFKAKLSAKVQHTAQKGKDDSTYSPFLKHFGSYKVGKLEEHEVEATQLIRDDLNELKQLVLSSTRPRFRTRPSGERPIPAPVDQETLNAMAMETVAIFKDSPDPLIVFDVVRRLKTRFPALSNAILIGFVSSLAEQENRVLHFKPIQNETM
jgi:hypothetical protein